METVNKLEWRKTGGLNNTKYRKTSLGRKFRVVACRPPLLNETYLKPSGVKGIYNVLVATCNHASKNYMIIKVF